MVGTVLPNLDLAVDLAADTLSRFPARTGGGVTVGNAPNLDWGELSRRQDRRNSIACSFNRPNDLPGDGSFTSTNQPSPLPLLGGIMAKSNQELHAEFRANVARVFTKMYATHQISDSGLRRAFDATGIQADIESNPGQTVTVKVTDPGLDISSRFNGLDAADLTPLAVDRLHGEALAATKRQVWTHVKSRQQSGYLDMSKATAILAELEFGTDYMPRERCSVSFEVLTGALDRYGDQRRDSFSVTVDGHLDEDETKAAIRAAYGNTPNMEIAAGLFPGAKVCGPEKIAYGPYVTNDVVWPAWPGN